MIIYVQWAKTDAEEWLPIDISRIQHLRQLPRKNKPTTGTTVIDNLPGWINAINCQGLVFEGMDGYNFQLVPEGIKITAWQDDPEDYNPDEFLAIEYTILDTAPDPTRGGIINTRQTIRIWAASAVYPQYAENINATVFPWSEWKEPTEGVTFYGVWLPNENFMQHKAVQSFHGWREWIN